MLRCAVSSFTSRVDPLLFSSCTTVLSQNPISTTRTRTRDAVRSRFGLTLVSCSWFEAAMGGRKPESGWPTLDMNSWRGAPYVYNESYHPTAWVGA